MNIISHSIIAPGHSVPSACFLHSVLEVTHTQRQEEQGAGSLSPSSRAQSINHSMRKRPEALGPITHAAADTHMLPKNKSPGAATGPGSASTLSKWPPTPSLHPLPIPRHCCPLLPPPLVDAWWSSSSRPLDSVALCGPRQRQAGCPLLRRLQGSWLSSLPWPVPFLLC